MFDAFVKSLACSDITIQVASSRRSASCKDLSKSHSFLDFERNRGDGANIKVCEQIKQRRLHYLQR